MATMTLETWTSNFTETDVCYRLSSSFPSFEY